MRKRIYELIELSREDDRASRVYDAAMIVLIVLSLVPLVFKQTTPLLEWIDRICVAVFIADYLLRFATADYKLGAGRLSFVRYPFTFMALVDLLSILPSLSFLNAGFKLLRLMRLSRFFRMLRLSRSVRVLRVLRMFRYSRSLRIIAEVLRRSKDSLLAVGALALAFIVISAMIIFNAEPESFNTFFDALYWATISLTTVGYGDIYPITAVGRIIAMLSSIFGVAIVALPSAIVTAGYMKVIEQKLNTLDNESEEETHGKNN